MAITTRITPCHWFDDQAEEAVRFYTGIFPSSRVTTISHYGEAGHDGLSWQVIPNDMDHMLVDAESPGAKRAMEAMLRMKTIDVEELRRAYAGA